LQKGLNNDIAVQGVPYDAGLLTNLNAGGADRQGIKEATKLFELASTKCPDSVLIGGGYSQGAALMHRSVESLTENIKSRIAGIVLYGDTQNVQDGGKIKNFPKEKVEVICSSSDGVCTGVLLVTPGHLSYSTASIQEGADFLIARVKAAKASSR
jgi:cutinase